MKSLLTILLFLVMSSVQAQTEIIEVAPPEPTGGPCEYEMVEVYFLITGVIGDHEGYSVDVLPVHEEDEVRLMNAYTSTSFKVKNEHKVQLKEGEQFQSSFEIMTEGSCNPDPQAISLKSGMLFSIYY